MKDCIFCKIVAGELPSHKVYEDADTLAFLSTGPNNPGHSLVIPKQHSENIYDMSDHSLATTIRSVQKVAKAVKTAMQADGINIAMNNDKAAGQVIYHPHFHVIPRFQEDGYHHWGQKTYKEGEADSVAEKIRLAL